MRFALRVWIIFIIVLLAVAAVLGLLFFRPVPAEIPEVAPQDETEEKVVGWCCKTRGLTCDASHVLGECLQNGGFFFSRRQQLCDQGCTMALPPSNE